MLYLHTSLSYEVKQIQTKHKRRSGKRHVFNKNKENVKQKKFFHSVNFNQNT